TKAAADHDYATGTAAGPGIGAARGNQWQQGGGTQTFEQGSAAQCALLVSVFHVGTPLTAKLGKVVCQCSQLSVGRTGGMTPHDSGFGVFATLEGEQLGFQHASRAAGNDRNSTTLIAVGAVTVGTGSAEYLDLQGVGKVSGFGLCCAESQAGGSGQQPVAGEFCCFHCRVPVNFTSQWTDYKRAGLKP